MKAKLTVLCITAIVYTAMIVTLTYADRKPPERPSPTLEERVAILEDRVETLRERLITHVTDEDFKCHICDLPPE